MKDKIKQIMRLASGEWYSNKRLKSQLLDAYIRLNIVNKPKASDITLYYNAVKRQKRNGVEQVNGYYIL